MKRYFYIFIFCLVAGSSYAMWQPIISHFTPQNYAAGTQNWQMAQATSGWMYAANNYGLLEYDGESWRIYGIWNSSVLHAVCVADDGAVYVGGTNDFGVFRGLPIDGLTYRSLADSVPASYRNFGDVWRVFYDAGLLYVQTRNYIFVCQESGHIDVVDPACIIYTSIMQDHCLYLATSNGIFLYSGRRLHTLQGSDLLKDKTIAGMAQYGSRALLIATDFSGVYIYDGSTIRPFQTDADAFLQRNQLYSVAVGHNNIAFGTVLHGLVITDLHGHNPVYLDRSQGMQNSTILSLLFDRDDNLWLGLDQGIDKVHLNSPLRYLQSSLVDYGSGYAYCEHDGYCYYGTNQGLYIQQLPAGAVQLVEGSLGQVWKLVSLGDALFCCHNRGLFQIFGSRVERLNIPDGVWNVHQLSSGRALACTYSGFYIIEKTAGRYDVVRRIAGYEETVLYSELDRYGNLWTISSRGVECLHFSDDFSAVSPTLILSDPTRTRYAINRVEDEVYVTAEGYFGMVDGDASLRDVTTEFAAIAQTHKFEILALDPDSNSICMFGGLLQVRHYDHVAHAYDTIRCVVMQDLPFFVGGFANIAPTSDGCAVLGGVDGFFRLDTRRAALSMPIKPWDVRPVRVVVPWYLRWWAWLLYTLSLAVGVYLIYKLISYRIRLRDQRLSAAKNEEIRRQEVRILQLETEQAQFDLKSKSRELNSVLLNQVNRNELSASIQQDVHRISELLAAGDVDQVRRQLRQLEARLSAGMHQDKDWKHFEENFDFVNDRFIRRLSARFPWMNKQEKKLCVYIYMGLQTKEIAPLLNLSTRGVEMMRYRLRQKMNLDAQANLRHYFEEMLSAEEG